MTSPSEKEPERRKGIFRRLTQSATRLTGSPQDALGWHSIRDGYVLIRTLWLLLTRTKNHQKSSDLTPRSEQIIPLRLIQNGYELYDDDFEKMLIRRQKETYYTALRAGFVAVVLFLFWATEMIFFHWTGSRVLSSVGFLPFLAILGFIALQNCSLNWQLRMRRSVTFFDFLNKAESIFPRLP